MAKCNNTLEFDKRIQFTGKAYLDPKAAPVATKAELEEITIVNDAFEGMERVVLSDEDYDGAMTKYRFDGEKWVIISPIITGDDVE
jgi:hypothetical protein